MGVVLRLVSEVFSMSTPFCFARAATKDFCSVRNFITISCGDVGLPERMLAHRSPMESSLQHAPERTGMTAHSFWEVSSTQMRST